MTQTFEEANQILNQLMDIAPKPAGITAEQLRRLSPQSKLINLLQQAKDEAWIEIMSMVPAVIDQTFLDWIERNAALARANDDDTAVQRFQRMTKLAEAMMEA